MLKIKSIYGHEPFRADEYPFCYTVGINVNTNGIVTRIELNLINEGPNAIYFYDVYVNEKLYCSVNIIAIAEFRYFEED